MARLLLIRHGDTKLNSGLRFWGSTDVELSDSGIKAAEQLRDRLTEENITTVYSSKLSRARVTAEIIASCHEVKVNARAELNEINFGWLEGLTFEEINKKHPEMAEVLSRWNAQPRFPGGESLDDLNSRVQVFMKKLENPKPKETVLIVSHAGTLRLLICNLLAIGVEHWRHIHLDLASLSIMDIYPEGAVLTLLNDISHLKYLEVI